MLASGSELVSVGSMVLAWFPLLLSVKFYDVLAVRKEAVPVVMLLLAVRAPEECSG